jgi:AraC family transcriptional regulator, ethanolamine operon transcriptional activator
MRHRLARKAAEFLHAHCREPLSIAEICAAVGANRRTLHLGFREVFGVTPITYLTALRLNGVRAHLLNSDACDFTITQVAMNWGFSHLGRFSINYRIFFGESPSAIVRRVRGGQSERSGGAIGESIYMRANRNSRSGNLLSRAFVSC